MKYLNSASNSWKLFSFVVTSVIVIFLPVAFLGLDLEDRGFHIYEQLQAFNSFGTPSKMIFLTNWIGGAWLQLLGNKYLYAWSICGGLILSGINLGLAALIVKELFDVSEKKIFLFCIIGTICAVYSQGFFSINYYPMPLMTTELFLLYFLKYRHCELPKKKIIYCCIAGIFAGLTPFLRLPTIYLIFVPATYEVFAKYYGIKRNKSIIYFFVSATITMGVCYLCLSKHWSKFPEYSFAVQGLGTVGGLKSLLKMPFFYLIQCYSRISLAIVILCLLVFIKKTKILQTKLIDCGCLIILCFIGIIYLYWSYGKDGSYWGIAPLMRYRKLLETLPFSLIIAMLIPEKIETTDSAFLKLPHGEIRLEILMICGVFIFFPFGTNTGLIKISYGFPILLPVCFILLEQYLEGMARTFNTMLVCMILSGLFLTGSGTYCDANRWRCRTMLKSANLQGIFSSTQKANLTDCIISEIKKHTIPNEEILFWGIEYTILIGSDCRSWCNMGYNYPQAAQDMFQQYCKHKPLPRVAFSNIEDKHYKSFGEDFLRKNYTPVFQKDKYLIWLKKTTL